MTPMNYALRLLFSCCLLVAALPAVETTPVAVKSVHDGDTITVEVIAGVEARIRLLCIDTPETSNNSHGVAMTEGNQAADALKALLPEKTMVRLWGPGDKLETDTYGRTLAVVLLGKEGMDSAQERMISAGWTPYWKKYGAIKDQELNARLTKAQDAAKEAKAGMWGSNAKWMLDKANETTAPKSQAPVNSIEPVPPTEAPALQVEAPKAALLDHWLNIPSGVRHNSRCRYFSNTANGRMCTSIEGRACGKCGG